MPYYMQNQEYFGMPVLPYFEPRYKSKEQRVLDNVERSHGLKFRKRCEKLIQDGKNPDLGATVYQAFCDLLSESKDKTPASERPSMRTNS